MVGSHGTHVFGGNVDVFEKLDCNLNMDSEIKCWRVRNEV